MENFITFDNLNSYSNFEYNSKASVLDAAFYLLNNTVLSYESENIKYINNFIVHIYSIICILLMNNSDNKLLYLVGKNNDLRTFCYNLIYMYDNNNVYNKNYISFYNDNNSNYLIDDFLYNRDSISDSYDNYLISYNRELINYVENEYMDNSILIQIENFENENIENWKIYLFIVVYYFIQLTNKISNFKRKTGSFILLITLKYTIIIYYFIGKLFTIDDDDRGELYKFLENNNYFKNKYMNIMDVFIKNGEDDTISSKYDSFNLILINDTLDEDLLKLITDEIFNQEMINNDKTRNDTSYILINFLDLLFTSNSKDAFYNLKKIVNNINDNFGGFELKEFYEEILSCISQNYNTDIIKEICGNTDKYDDYKYITQLENVYDTFMYSFLNIDFENEKIKNNIIFLCEEINNIYKNTQLNSVFYEIMDETEEGAEYFFRNQINLYAKLLLINDNFGFYDIENNTIDNNINNSDNKYKDCNDNFHLKNLKKPYTDVYDVGYENIQIGHSSLGKKYSLQIPLTKKLFFTDVCYCGNNINLENFPEYFKENYKC